MSSIDQAHLQRNDDGRAPLGRLRVGIDAVSVKAIESSLADFGGRFCDRVFTPHEIAVANGPPDRLAARFAAKEAAIKAFDLAEVGVGLREIELNTDGHGRPSLRFYGRASESVLALGATDISVSLTHEKGLALAAVVALLANDSAAQ